MTRAELEALARRVETEEPSRELDAAIWGASGQFGYFEDFMGGDENAPRYTTSLDAAAALVPEGWNWSVERFVFDAVMPYAKAGAKASVWRDSRNPKERIFNVEAPTPAAALTAAALRALAQEQADDR